MAMQLVMAVRSTLLAHRPSVTSCMISSSQEPIEIASCMSVGAGSLQLSPSPLTIADIFRLRPCAQKQLTGASWDFCYICCLIWYVSSPCSLVS